MPRTKQKTRKKGTDASQEPTSSTATTPGTTAASASSSGATQQSNVRTPLRTQSGATPQNQSNSSPSTSYLPGQGSFADDHSDGNPARNRARRRRRLDPSSASSASPSSSSSTSPPRHRYNIAEAEIILGKEYKVDNQKMVVLAKFGNEEGVLKIEAVAGALLKANVLAGKWIDRLDLENVTAPWMEDLALPEDKQEYLAALKHVTDQLSHSKEKLTENIKKVKEGNGEPDDSTAAIVSDQAPGETVEALLGEKNIPYVLTYKAVLDAAKQETILKDTYAKKLQEAKVWAKPKQGEEGWNVTQLQGNPPDRNRLEDFDEWVKKQDELVANLPTLRLPEPNGLPRKVNRAQAKTKLELQVILAKLGDRSKLGDRAKLDDNCAKKAVEAVAAARERVARLEELQTWLNKPEGTNALIRMAAVDVIVGMEDRLIRSFNGGNFTFDGESEQLFCIDNSKHGPDLYKDQGEYEKWLREWFPTLAGELTERLLEGLKEMGVDGKVLVTPPRVGEILLDVATKAREVASSPKNENLPGAAKIRERAQYVLYRLLEEQKTWVPQSKMRGISQADREDASRINRKLEAVKAALKRSGDSTDTSPAPSTTPAIGTTKGEKQRNQPGERRDAEPEEDDTALAGEPLTDESEEDGEDTLDDAGRPTLTSATLPSLPDSTATTPPATSPQPVMTQIFEQRGKSVIKNNEATKELRRKLNQLESSLTPPKEQRDLMNELAQDPWFSPEVRNELDKVMQAEIDHTTKWQEFYLIAWAAIEKHYRREMFGMF
jgi:hypothetical protein